MAGTIVERIIDGQAWWVDSETGRTYGITKAVPEESARRKLARRQARAAKAPLISEAQIQNTCTDWLALDGWRAIVTDPPHMRGLGVTEKGIPDRLYLRYTTPNPLRLFNLLPTALASCELFWCEWKRKGGKAATHQRAWIETERARGALVWIAGEDFPASIEGFMEHYRHSGLCRRKL